MENNRKIIIAVTGASGSIYANILLRSLAGLLHPPAEIALVFTSNAEMIWEHELGKQPLSRKSGQEDEAWTKMVRLYDNKDFTAPFASGSSRYDTMIICPSSMGMLGRIANGVADDLVSRAADVMLKERRKLIILPRETPYNLIHINNMKLLTEAGAIILPATPSFYSKPKTIEELVQTVTDRIMDLAGFGIKTNRWGLLS